MMQTAPASIQDLVHSSIYYELLENDEENLRFFCDNQLNGNSDAADFRHYLDMADDGRVVYYAPNSRGEFNVSAVGEFVRVHIPQADGSLESHYIHHGQLFQPSTEAKAELDLLIVVLGVMYQGTRIQIAKTDSYLQEAEDENYRLERMRRVYARFSTAITNLDPRRENAFGALSAEELGCFLELGLRSPTENFITGVQMPPFYEEYLYQNQRDRYFNFLPGAKLRWFCWDVKNGELEKRVLLEKSGLGVFKPHLALPESTFLEKANSTPENASAVIDLLMAQGPEIVSEITRDPLGRPVQRRYGIGQSQGDGYEVETWVSAEKPMKIRPVEFAERHSWEWIKSHGANVYLNLGHLQSFSDTVRLNMDSLNNKLQSIMARVQMANDELQEMYHMATDTLSAVEDTRQRVNRNLHA